MKAIFFSDIHGIVTNLNKIEERIIQLNPDYIIVLGDVYGSNKEDNEYIYNFLMKYRDRLILLLGNCDDYNDLCVDEMLLNLDGMSVLLNHGHIYNYDKLSKVENSNILIYGHKHIPYVRKKDDFVYICVGSISLPRNEFGPTYMVYDGKFIIYDIYDNVICEYTC